MRVTKFSIREQAGLEPPWESDASVVVGSPSKMLLVHSPGANSPSSSPTFPFLTAKYNISLPFYFLFWLLLSSS